MSRQASPDASCPEREASGPAAVGVSEQEKEKVVGTYLVNAGAHRNLSESSSTETLGPGRGSNPPAEAATDVGCPSHKLMGGSMVRDVYKWYESATGTGAGLKRSKSQNDGETSSLRRERSQKLRSPGGFRRDYLRDQAARDGREPPRPTSTFMDFLYVQGQFEGEYPRENETTSIAPRSLKWRCSTVDTADVEKADFVAADVERQVPKITAAKAVFMLLKGFIGTGVLFIPRGFLHGGLLFSLILLISMGYINYLAMLGLFKCREKVSGSFGEIAGQLFGPRMRVMVKFSIVMMQLGICCIYILFVSKTVKSVAFAVSGGSANWELHFIIMFELLCCIPMSWIRQIQKLSPIVVVANLFIVLGLGYVYINSFTTLAQHGLAEVFTMGNTQAVYINPLDLALFVGVAIFSFEGIGLVLPIVESMEEPEKFPAVLRVSLFIVTVIFSMTGAICFVTFGNNTKSLAFENFAPGDVVGIIVQILYAIAVILSVPLCMFPAIRIMENAIFIPPRTEKVEDSYGTTSSEKEAAGKLGDGEVTPRKAKWFQGTAVSGRMSLKVKWLKNLFRASVCILAAAVAYGGAADFEKFVNIVGAFACVPLMFIYPAVFHYVAAANTLREKLIDIFLVIVGAGCMVFVTFMTIKSWIEGTGGGGH